MADRPSHRLFGATWSEFSRESQLRPLPQTRRGGESLAAALASLGALEDQPVLIEDQNSTAFINALDDFLNTIPTESAIVYLSSHGLYPTPDAPEFRLATGDTRELNDRTRSVMVNEVLARLRTSQVSRALLIIDACYAGSASAMDARSLADVSPPVPQPRIAYLAAVGGTRAALAFTDEEVPVFTGALVSLLLEGIADGPELLSAQDIHRALTTRLDAADLPVPMLSAEGDAATSPLLPNNVTPGLRPVSSAFLGPDDDRAQILYVDDEENWRETFYGEVTAAGHEVSLASDPDEARLLVESNHFDIIVVDLFLVDDDPATELIAYLSHHSNDATCLLVTRMSKGTATNWESLASVFQYPSPLQGLLFKETYTDFVLDLADTVRSRRRAVLEHITGLDSVVPLVVGRIVKRDPQMAQIRRMLELQVRACIEALVRRWFAPGNDATDYVRAMAIQPFGSGRSSCTVLAMIPDIRGVEPAEVSPLLMKLGPSEEIREEANRFNKYVQIGVPLELRTDRVNYKSRGHVGGVLYSLLGSHTEGATELRSQPEDVIRRALEAVLGSEGKRWLASSATGEGVRLLTYFAEHDFPTARFRDVLEQMRSGLEKAGSEWPDRLENLLEHHAYQRKQHATLVHGDMHLENIVQYGHDRYALIDYRNVGIGPRMLDFTTMEISCWLLCEPPEDSRSRLLSALLEAMRTHPPRDDVAPWCRGPRELALLCRELAVRNFIPKAPDGADLPAAEQEVHRQALQAEYGCVLWLSAVRRFEFKSTATSSVERRAMRVVPTALALTAQEMVET